jgi:hypothetical protein
MKINGREEVNNMAKFIARVFVPMYIEIEAENEKDAQQVAAQWYKEQKKDWKEPTVEVMPIR